MLSLSLGFTSTMKRSLGVGDLSPAPYSAPHPPQPLSPVFRTVGLRSMPDPPESRPPPSLLVHNRHRRTDEIWLPLHAHAMSEAVESPLSGFAIVRRLFSFSVHVEIISINEGQPGWKRKPARTANLSKCATVLAWRP